MTLLPEVRQELMATAARRATIGGRRRGLPRIRLGWIAAVTGVCAVLAVAAIALVALRQQPSGTHGTAAASSLSALEAKLAILRRPQTPADRRLVRGLPRAQFLEASGYVARLTRLAATVNVPTVGPLSVVLYVQRFPDVILSNGRLVPRSRHQTPTVDAVVVARGRVANSTSPLTAAMLGQPGNVTSGLNIAGRVLNPNLGISVGIVPDGVAGVRWTFSGAGFGILHPHPVTVYARVHDNVAIGSIVSGEGPLLEASWYSADGRLIASGRGGLGARQQLQQINAVNASRNVPIAPLLRAHYSLFRSVAPDNPARDRAFATEVVGAGGGAGPLNYFQARYIPSVTGLDGRGLWVIPGRDGICIDDPEAGGCGKLGPRDETGIVGGGTANATEETLEGLVPNGNRSVTFVLASGSRVTAPVVDHNVYEVTVHGRIVAIVDRNDQGKLVERTIVGDQQP